jgi:AAA domain/Bacterial transcriptional activator domain
MLLTKTCVPRLTPFTIHRPRLERWLHAYAQTPVRLIVAPSGAGKTTLLLTYAAESQATVAYCALPPDCDQQQLRELVAEALGLDKVPASYPLMVQAVCAASAGHLELAIDDIDNAGDEALEDLMRFVEDLCENVTLIYAARSRERIQARRLIARGLGEVCDGRRMGFHTDEADLFAQACGAHYSEVEICRLVDETDGWAMALCATIRLAAAEGETLPKAFDHWRRQSSAFLHELISAELDRVSEEDRSLFWNLLSGRTSGDRMQLRRLEASGLFIYEDGEMLRPYRALRPPAAKGVHASSVEHPQAPPLIVHMFQSFDAKLGGRDIPWVRRRDQQIVKYLLLKPDGKATRAELASVFWSDTDKHLATQSVRTACSTIRKAFAAIVGYGAVDSYFRTVPDVQIDLNHVVCDARRFSAHIADAESAFSRGDQQGAAMHYRAAEKLYAGRLLDFEAPEPWFAAHARALQDRYLLLLERLGDIAFEQEEYVHAQQYARRAQAIQPDLPGIVQLLERLAFVGRLQREQKLVEAKGIVSQATVLDVRAHLQGV